MKINVGVSNRHVHLTKDALETLFGKDYKLEIQKPLSQKGQFATTSFVTIKGPKGQIENVRILGPERNYNQIEISKTDSFKLGLNPPVRNSGDLENSSPITIVGPLGELNLDKGCIIATRHIHISTEDLNKFGFKNNEKVFIRINSEKSAVLGDVYLKASEDATLELHIDTDDANANLVKQNDTVELVKVTNNE